MRLDPLRGRPDTQPIGPPGGRAAGRSKRRPNGRPNGRDVSLSGVPPVIGALYDAYQRDDVEGIMNCYTDAVTFHVDGPEGIGGDHVGSAAVRALLEQTIPLASSVEKQVLDTVADGDDRITVRLKFHLEVAGEPLTNTAVHMHRLEDNLIAETWIIHLDEDVARRFWDEQGTL